MKNTHYYCTYKKLLVLGLFFFFLTLGTKGFSQKLVSIPNTIELPFKSKINKTNYSLHIALPYGYEKSTEDYPTIYLLDANNDFPLVTSISRRLEAEDNLKKFVIVGIGLVTKKLHGFIALQIIPQLKKRDVIILAEPIILQP